MPAETQPELDVLDRDVAHRSKHGPPLADSDAERRQPVLAPRRRSSCSSVTTAASQRVANCRAAVHVHPLRGRDRAPRPRGLRREGFVQLDEVDVADRDAGAREQLLHRRHRADAHHARSTLRDAHDRNAPSGARRLRLAPRSRARRRRRRSRSSSRAVTEPSARNAGFSVASFSVLASGRGCSSRTASPTVRVRRRRARLRPGAAASAARTRPARG